MNTKELLSKAGNVIGKTVNVARTITATGISSGGDFYTGVVESGMEALKTVTSGVAAIIVSDPERKIRYKLKTQISAVKTVSTMINAANEIVDNISGPGTGLKYETEFEKGLKWIESKIENAR